MHDQAQAAALLHTYTPCTTLGLHFGVDSTQVQHHLDSLRQHDELT